MNQPQITPELVASHGLKPDEYERILKLIGRVPSFTELGIFSAMWNEHCSYKSSRLHLRGLPTKAPWVIQGPGENAGVIDIGGRVIWCRAWSPASAATAIRSACRPSAGKCASTPAMTATSWSMRWPWALPIPTDRKSTRLNSSHRTISYADFCLKKKTTHITTATLNDTTMHRTASAS